MRIALIWKNKDNLQNFQHYEVAEKVSHLRMYDLRNHFDAPPSWAEKVYRLRSHVSLAGVSLAGQGL